MKRMGQSLVLWAMSSSANRQRRKLMRANRSAELLEVRAVLDASSTLVAMEQPAEDEGRALEVESEETVDPVIFYTLGGAASAPPPVTQFESREQFGEYLIERALQRYEGYFDQPQWFYRGPIFALADGGFQATALNDARSLDFSETNTQVDGVDEGDIIESDGNYLYVLNGQDLLIVKAVPAGDLQQTARVRIDGSPVAEYLDGNRLTVISSEFAYANYYSLPFRGRFYSPGSSSTIVSTFDITDRANPTLVKQATIDGSYIDSRSINGQVHLITTNDVSLPEPELDGTTTIDVPIYYPIGIAIDEPFTSFSEVEAPTGEVDAPLSTMPTGIGTPITETVEVEKYESRESYIARIRETLDELIDEVVPRYEVITSGGLAAEGAISEIESISRIADANSDSLMSVITIDTRDTQPGLVSSSSLFASYSNGIYANRDHLYVFSPIWEAEHAQTRVLEFAWANGDRAIELLATGVIDGTLLNQFSADEFEGKLRVATTTSSFANNTFTQANNLVVLENVNGTLTQVGAVENFAANEQIYSVRFNGDQAFVVTFRRIDPLFVFDLSDPTTPVITGELEVPGYSSYLKLIDQNHLLAIGRSTTDAATKVALYDVSDPANPVEVDEDILPSWTWSIAEWDHKAVGYFGAKQTLAIPVSSYSHDTNTARNELFVFKFDVSQTGENAIRQIGTVTDDSYIVRSAYIGDTLYTISGNSVIASQLTRPSQIIDTFDIAADFDTPEIDIEPIFTEVDDGASDWDYTNAPDTAEEADDLLALGARNLLTGQVRITLLQSDGDINVSLANGSVIASSQGHDTETVSLSGTESLVIDGTEAADRINLNFGNPGTNSLGEIVVSGKLGNDRINITSVAATLNGLVMVNGDEGHDTITVTPTVRTTVKISGGLGRDTLTGGAGRDWIHGGPNNDVIEGGAGDDTLNGGGGSDFLYGRNGNDLMIGGGGEDYLNGGNGNDTVDGGEGADNIRGSFGNDLLKGGNGNDYIRGDEGDDTILGGAGNDRLGGGVGNDAIAGGDGDDQLFGDDGKDSLLGGAGNDALRGGIGKDVCLGQDGDDFVDGEATVGDTVSGGAGTDLVFGRQIEIDETFILQASWLSLI